MKRINLVPLAAVAAMMATTGISAHAQGVFGSTAYSGNPTDGSGFELITLGGDTGLFQGFDNSGRVAAAGTVNQYSSTFGSVLPSSFTQSPTVPNVIQGTRADLIVGGNYNPQTNISDNGGATKGDIRVAGLYGGVPPPPNYIPGSSINFANLITAYTNFSNDLYAQLTSTTFNGEQPQYGGLGFGTNAGTVGYSDHINVGSFGNFNIGYDYSACCSYGTLVENYDTSGSAGVVHFNSAGIDPGNNGQSTIYNLPNATTITIQGTSFKGTIIAPNATITIQGAGVIGTIIAKGIELDSGGTISYQAFTGTVPTFNDVTFPTLTPEPAVVLAPEPSAWASMGIGMFSLLGLTARARRARRNA